MRYFFKKRLHVSWLLAAASGAVLAGVWAAGQVSLAAFAPLAWLLTGTALVLLGTTAQKWVMIVPVLVGGFLIGAWRGQIEQSALTAYQSLHGKTLTLQGTVSDDADVDARGNRTLRLRNIHFGQHSLAGQVWVSVPGQTPAQRSDVVTIRGQLKEGFGTFAGVMYRAEVVSIERPSPGDVALAVRDWFAGLVRQVIPDPEAALGIGYLVGQRRALPEELDTALQVAGLTHVVVASGYNLTILVRFARRAFMRISKYTAALVSSGLIVSFIAITGLSPSMSRAGLIAGLSLAAWYYGRKFHPLVLLPFAAAITVLINPSYAWGDVGWQLSFAAFAGVMLLAPLLQAYYFGPQKPGTVRQIFGETLSATLMTLPILLYTFGYMSNVALIANLLVLPLVPLAMLLTFMTGLAVWVAPALGAVAAVPTELLLHYMTQTAMALASLPWAVSELTVEMWHVVAMYVILAVFMYYMWCKTRLNLRDTNLVE